MIDRLIEIGIFYGREINVENTKVTRISGKISLVKIMIFQSQLEKVEYFSYLRSVMTSDTRCTHKIKFRIAW
jgi:hypothetical protein